MRKKSIALILVSIMMFSATGCSPSSKNNNSTIDATASGQSTEESSTQKQMLTFAGGNSSTEAYTYWVAVNKAVKTMYPELDITTVDATGGFDIAQRIRAGSIDAGNGVSVTDYDSYAGTGKFEGQGAKEDLRVMWYYTESPINFCVDETLGLKYVNELNGVRMHPGGTGSTNTLVAMEICSLLGVEPNWFEASSSDGIDAVMNRQISGAVRNGSAPDSQIIQMQSAINLSFLTLTDEEVGKIKEAFPYLNIVTIPAGSYDGQDYDYVTVATAQGGITTTVLPQEEGYKYIKAMMSEEGKSQWGAAYPKGMEVDVIDLTLRTAQAPLHAGTVQYFKEIGVDVPEELIPPEYVPVN
ncbi:MAG: TAXI family TRAP transporter solute-binding subunit [Lachnospiraceae bacterium]|nr:TAXI family TRAP transporter solute-binding subunit [Lachnospiraceae bacterium]